MYRVGKQQKKRATAYVLCGLLLVAADVVFAVRIAFAAPPYTPYANSVAAQSGVDTGTANNAVGAPDGQVANLVGTNASITLDMGDGEEGTNALRIYFGQINLQAQVRVEFLDDNQALLKSEDRQLFLDLMPSTQTFAYDWHTPGKGYRFVRLTSLLGVSVGLDSVEALGFIGSTPTQDTDGDGIPDRQDNEPLAFNTPSNNGGGNNGGNNNGGSGGSSQNNSSNSNSNSKTTTSTTTNTVIRQPNTNGGSGATNVVNNPPVPTNDKDGDQMTDDWELAHGLDPNNQADGTEDTDKDGLLNMQEYQFDTDPRNNDTDMDGIPDGWEVAHGLNAKVNDAEQDPDGDFVTNRGEYFFDVNPYRSDEFYALAAKIQNKAVRFWSWAIFVILLVLASLAFLQGRKLVVARSKK